MGQYLTNGTLLALEEINAQGRILGKKIRVITYDTKDDPAEAINAYNGYYSKSKQIIYYYKSKNRLRGKLLYIACISGIIFVKIFPFNNKRLQILRI